MHRPLVIAHRGNSSAAPENTLSAFRSALVLGVDGVELDYHVSADGVPVVFHDNTLERTTNAARLWNRSRAPVAGCTLAELQALDCGGWFGDKREFANEPIPTLEQALELICGAGALCVIERKSGPAASLISLLHRKNVVSNVVVMAFDWPFLVECRELDPDVRLVALGDGMLTARRLKNIAQTPATIVGWDQRQLNARRIANIKVHGFQAWTWTVDNPERMRALIAAGIDAITSNYPARVLDVLAGE